MTEKWKPYIPQRHRLHQRPPSPAPSPRTRRVFTPYVPQRYQLMDTAKVESKKGIFDRVSNRKLGALLLTMAILANRAVPADTQSGNSEKHNPRNPQVSPVPEPPKQILETSTLQRGSIPWMPPEVEFWYPLIAMWSNYFGIPPKLAALIAFIESGGDANPRGNQQAFGLYQVTIPTGHQEAQEIGLYDPNFVDPEHSIAMGLSYLQEQLIAEGYKPFSGEVDLEIAARAGARYNGGPGGAKRAINFDVTQGGHGDRNHWTWTGPDGSSQPYRYYRYIKELGARIDDPSITEDELYSIWAGRGLVENAADYLSRKYPGYQDSYYNPKFIPERLLDR